MLSLYWCALRLDDIVRHVKDTIFVSDAYIRIFQMDIIILCPFGISIYASVVCNKKLRACLAITSEFEERIRWAGPVVFTRG